VDEEDGEAVARSLAGEPEAFAGLVRRHGQVVHGYLFRRSDRQTADDLLGEVWLRAFRSRQTYDRAWPSARPWLYGIAGNVLRAHWRQRTIRPDPRVQGADDPWPDTDARLDAAGYRTALRAALGDLGDKDREVLLLVAWECLTPAEAAVSLDIPPGTARWRLHRARTALQSRLNETVPQSRPDGDCSVPSSLRRTTKEV
jgi:RNA polymerase sigma factor (sigma-70 family)